MFKTLGREHHEKAKGAKLMDVHMAPGDLLYLPRGQYHDALADEGGTVHVAFGVTYPIGMDVISFLFERVAAEPEFRANLPRQGGPDGGPALSARLSALGDRICTVLDEPTTAAQIAALQRGFRYPAPRLRAARRCWPSPPTTAFGCAPRASAWSSRMAATAWSRKGSRAATEVPADVGALVALGARAARVLACRAGGGVPRAAERPARSAAARSRRDAPDRAAVTGGVWPCGNIAASLLRFRQFSG